MDSGSPAVLEGDRRFFIVTASRTGSSLLAAILADAGAMFGMDAPCHWDPSGGALEHPDFLGAAHYYRSAAAIAPERPARFGIARLRWVAYRSLAKRRLREGLARARYIKLEAAHELIRPAFCLGIFPTIIVSYRSFAEQAVSLGMLRPDANWDFLRARYQSTYGNALWLLNTFGGCVIGYERLHEGADDAWAQALAQTTGLPATRLIEARNRRIDHPPSPIAARTVDPALDSLFAALQALDGKVIAPSQPALRAWRSAQLQRAGDALHHAATATRRPKQRGREIASLRSQ